MAGWVGLAEGLWRKIVDICIPHGGCRYPQSLTARGGSPRQSHQSRENRRVTVHDDSRGSAELRDGAFGGVGELDAELVELSADLVGAGPVALLAGLGPVRDELL